jgi:hypothetical protein
LADRDKDEAELTTRERALKAIEEARAKVRRDAKEAQHKREAELEQKEADKKAAEVKKRQDKEIAKKTTEPIVKKVEIKTEENQAIIPIAKTAVQKVDKKKAAEAKKRQDKEQKEADKKVNKEQKHKQQNKDIAKETPVTKMNKERVYSGNIRLLITSAPDVVRLNAFKEFLQTSPAIKIIGSGGLSGQGFLYYLALNGEVRLVEFLANYDQIDKVIQKNEEIILTFIPLF